MSSHPRGEASPDDLPPILESPPWTRERPKAAPVVVAGLSAPDGPRIAWLPQERETWRGAWKPGWAPDTDWDAAVARVRSVDEPDLPRALLKLAAAAPDAWAHRLVAEAATADWLDPDLAGFLAARFELDVLPHLFHVAAANPAHTGGAVLPYLSAPIAELMADWLVRLKTSRDHATGWLLRHGTDAAELLIPAALGKAGKRRRDAAAALLFLAGRAGPEPVLAAAKRHGDAALAAIRVLLDTDPLTILPAKPRQPPDWATASGLPPLLSRTGRRLPDESVDHVVTMLSISKPDQVYAGVAVVREHCDPVSLADFGWALFQAWRSARFPTAYDWAAVQLRWTADEHTLRKLAKMMRAWRKPSRITAGLAAFAGREGHLEALYLDELSRDARDLNLRIQADARLAGIASRRGLDVAELRDRLLPDPGLDPEGRLKLDFGPRRFTVGFDAELRPVIVDDKGKRRRSLPKPGVRDDAGLATVALRRFAGLKQDIDVLLAGQLHRWEAAMCAGRHWRPADFEECFVRHRLLGPVARRLVWLCHNGDTATAFRVAEDGGLATVDEAEFTVPPGAQVSLPHPIDFVDELARWRELFDDYELLQPFPQLDREFHRLDAGELGGSVLHRFTDRELSRGRFNGLLLRQWRLGERDENYKVDTIIRSVSAEHRIVVTVRPGVLAGDYAARQTITRLRLVAETDGCEPSFRDLSPAAVSELLTELIDE